MTLPFSINWNTREAGLRSQFLRAGVAGLLAGGVAVAFNLLTRLAESSRTALIVWAHDVSPWGILFWPPIAAAMAMLAVWLAHKYAPETSGSGIPHVKAVLQHVRQLRWRKVLPIKLLGGVLALGSGLSLGREGPTVQMGAAAAQLTALLLKLPRRTHNRLIAAGAGAGLAAAFNAPLSGFVFVIEELRRELSPQTSTLALIAAIIADVVSRGVFGQESSFSVRSVMTPPLATLPISVIIGVIAGLLGTVFSRGLMATLKWAQVLKFRTRLILSGVLAATIGVIAWWLPEIAGGGYTHAQELLKGSFDSVADIHWLVLFLAFRLLFTLFSYATGAPGGIFAPMLALGATMGLTIGLIAREFLPLSAAMPIAFAVVGMAALFTAIVRAPLTGIILVVEMTMNYSLLLPLMVGSLTAFIVAERLKVKPIYESLLETTIAATHVHEGIPIWLDTVIEANSPLDGKLVKDLCWPQGCLIVTITRDGYEHTPKSSMRLKADDRLRIVVDESETDTIDMIMNSVKVIETITD